MTVRELAAKLAALDQDAEVTVAYPDPDPALRDTDWSVRFRPVDWFDVQGSGKQVVIGAVGKENL